jgi:hypothetical protein
VLFSNTFNNQHCHSCGNSAWLNAMTACNIWHQRVHEPERSLLSVTVCGWHAEPAKQVSPRVYVQGCTSPNHSPGQWKESSMQHTVQGSHRHPQLPSTPDSRHLSPGTWPSAAASSAGWDPTYSHSHLNANTQCFHAACIVWYTGGCWLVRTSSFCRECTAGSVLQGVYCRECTAGSVLQGVYCRECTAGSVLQGPWRALHAPAAAALAEAAA